MHKKKKKKKKEAEETHPSVLVLETLDYKYFAV